MIRVALCDDAVAFKAMARILLQQDGDIEVTGLFDDGAALRAGLDGLDADVLLLDLVLPDVEDPAALVAEVRERAPGVRVLLCSGSTEEQVEAARVATGADAATTKAAGGGGLRDAVRALAG